MEAAIDTSPSPAPPPASVAETASHDAVDSGPVINGTPTADAPKGEPIVAPDSEVPISLDHAPDAQPPEIREAFGLPPEEPPEQRETPQPQEALPQEPAIPLPDVFSADEASAWDMLPRETQAVLAQTIEFTKAKLQPQLTAAVEQSTAHAQAMWGAVGIHSQKARALAVTDQRLLEFAQRSPQELERFLKSPDGERWAQQYRGERAAVAQEAEAIRNHGVQVLQQMQEAKRVESEQLQSHFDNVWAPSQDDAFWDRMEAVIPADQQDALQDQAVETLLDAGFSEDEIREGYERSGMMRDARSQIVIAKAALWDQQQARQAAAKEAAQRRDRERSRATPRPLMPGVGGGATPPSATLARAAAEGDMGTYIALRNRGARY